MEEWMKKSKKLHSVQFMLKQYEQLQGTNWCTNQLMKILGKYGQWLSIICFNNCFKKERLESLTKILAYGYKCI